MPLPEPRQRARFILQRLEQRYPAPESELRWQNPWELLVATVLAAQCTDQRVNQVTPGLFARWPDTAALAQAGQEELEAVIHSTGFYRNKARHLIATARRIQALHNGEVPRSMAELTALPGVARKTANIVLSNAFGLHLGLAVDTHVKRLAFRLGLTTATDPVRIEQELMPLFPQERWGDVNHMLVLYGREICVARKPRCEDCVLADLCPRCGLPTAKECA